MFQKTLREVLLALMMMLFLTSGIVIGAGQEPALTPKAAKDEILLATSQGVSIIGKDGWSVLDESKGLPHNRVNAIAVDKEGRIWVAHGSGLSVLDQDQWTHYLRFEMFKALGFSINDIDALACDAQGRTWAGHSQGLYVIENGEWKTYEGSVFGPKKYVGVKDIAIDAEERVWVAHNYGVSVFDGNDWTLYDEETSDLPSRFTEAIAIDHEGKVWVAHNYGVSVFDGNNWTNYGSGSKSDVEVKALRQAKDIAIDNQNRIWVVTSARGVSVFDRSEWKTYTRTNSGLIGGRGEVIACDAQGRVWVGTDWELAVFDDNQWLTYTQATSDLAANGIQAITFIGGGPSSFPLPYEAQPGSVSGKLISQEVPVVGAEINICWSVSWPLFFGPTPCKGEVYKAVTDSEGQFSIVNIPPGAYKLAIRIMEEEKANWHAGGGIGGVPSTVHIISGEETCLDKLSIEK